LPPPADVDVRVATARSASPSSRRSTRLRSRGRARVPETLYEQPARARRLVVPVGGQRAQRLELIVRSPEGPAVVHSVPCRFVPLVGEEGRA
jgi:protein-L-isoaspartate O-methyltransferase